MLILVIRHIDHAYILKRDTFFTESRIMEFTINTRFEPPISFLKETRTDNNLK